MSAPHQSRRNAWHQHCIAQLELHDVAVYELQGGSKRLVSRYGDLTVADIADMSRRELADVTGARQVTFETVTSVLTNET
jgi:hypothetical protein